jgi:hypothetical protein
MDEGKVRTLPIVLMLAIFGWTIPWEASLALVIFIILAAIIDAQSWNG